MNPVAQLESDMLTQLRAAFDARLVAQVIAHAGSFDADAVQRYARKANALILTAHSGTSHPAGGVVQATTTYDLFILVKGNSLRARTLGINLIYAPLLGLLHKDAWTTDVVVKAPANVQSKNLFGSAIDEMGLALWVVRWDQYFEIPYLTDYDALDDFRTLYDNIQQPGNEDPTLTQVVEMEVDE